MRFFRKLWAKISWFSFITNRNSVWAKHVVHSKNPFITKPATGLIKWQYKEEFPGIAAKGPETLNMISIIERTTIIFPMKCQWFGKSMRWINWKSILSEKFHYRQPPQWLRFRYHSLDGPWAEFLDLSFEINNLKLWETTHEYISLNEIRSPESNFQN